MERADKHGPSVDDGLHRETEPMERSGREPHTEEWRQPEPSGEGQPDVDRVPNGTLTGGTPPGMDEGDVEGRAELARYLRASQFPATSDVLVAAAAGEEAPDAVLRLLHRLPTGRTFENVQDVWSALGGGVEAHRT